MSAIRIALRLLLANDRITELVGQSVFPVAAPQEVGRPYVAVSLVFEEQDTVLAGHRDGYTSRVSFACVADAVQVADAIGEAVKAAMAEVINVEVLYDAGDLVAFVTAWKEGTDLIDFTDDRKIFRRIIDYRMRWVR